MTKDATRIEREEKITDGLDHNGTIVPEGLLFSFHFCVYGNSARLFL